MTIGTVGFISWYQTWGTVMIIGTDGELLVSLCVDDCWNWWLVLKLTSYQLSIKLEVQFMSLTSNSFADKF